MMNTELHSLYNSLISILEEEIKVFRELHSSLEHERKVLAGSSVDDLYASNATKENCILKAGMFEEARTRLMGRIAAALGLQGKRMAFSALLPHGDDTQKKALQECRSILRFLLTDIQKRNERNKMLLDDSLSYVQKSVDFLGQLVYPGATYLKTGRLKGSNLNGKLVSREG